MSLEDIAKWTEKELVTMVLKNRDFQGAFSKQTVVREIPSMKDNWASDMFEIDLVIEYREAEQRLPLVMKVIKEDEKVRNLMESPKQFSNEIHFYSTILQFLASRVSSAKIKSEFESLFPRCYYSYYNQNKMPETFKDAVILMEDLKVRGYKLGPRESLDLKHCILALKNLGLFHAFSYFMKEQDVNSFMNTVVSPIQESSYIPCKMEATNAVFGACQRRVIDALARNSLEGDLGLATLRSLALRKPFDVFSDMVQPREPLAVLCHGDFLRNNILFRYENGDPVEMKFIDFQTIRYASPAIDLSVLICMNTTHELRVSHFDELLQVYHTSLVDTMSSLLNKPKDQLDQRYSFRAFVDEFELYAAYGYLISVDFRAAMMASEEELAELVKLNSENRCSPKFTDALTRAGGERVTQVMVDLAKDLIDKNCLLVPLNLS